MFLSPDEPDLLVVGTKQEDKVVFKSVSNHLEWSREHSSTFASLKSGRTGGTDLRLAKATLLGETGPGPGLAWPGPNVDTFKPSRQCAFPAPFFSVRAQSSIVQSSRCMKRASALERA